MIEPQKRASISGSACAFVLVLAALASAEAPARQAVVLTAVENMYSAPDASRDVVSQALLGQLVAVVEVKDAFARIETPDGYRGWVPQGSLFVYPDERASRYAAQGTVAEVVALMANVYRDPDVTTARPKTQAPLGARLEVVKGPEPPEAPEARWLSVLLPSGETGFVQSGDVRVMDAAAARPRGNGDDIVGTARRFLGVPYTWGGMSARGVDCSGLTSRVYWVNGLTLPRDADMQFDDPGALAVDRDQLQKGDLVFFGKTKITHVGIYVGAGAFINATTHGAPTVHEERLEDPHWTALYRGARRPR
jgi:cell wall-associated NlpC family hydrolase